MEERRAGPPDDPDRTVDAAAAIGWGTGAAAGTALAGSLIGYVVLNVVADQALVSRLCALAVPAVTFAVAAGRLRRSERERRGRAVAWVAVAALAGGAFTLRAVGSVRPTFPQIAASLPDSDLPAGYLRIGEERLGDRLCRDDCPRIIRYYRPPAGVADPVRDVVLRLYERGWSPEDPLAPRGASPAALKDRIRVHVAVLEPGRLRIYLDEG